MKETEQTLLDQIKNDVAKDHEYSDFRQIFPDLQDFEHYSLIITEIAERYYQAKAQASCEADNKPDFEQIASFRSDITDHSMFLGFRSGCEHVWNTHVVPLQKELAHEVNQREEYFEDAQILLDDKKKLESEIKALREEMSDKSKTCADLTILLSKEMEKVNKLMEEIERLKSEVLKEKFPEN